MNDLISRQAAIDALEWTWAGKAAFDAIKNLPSAQPELIRCGECKHRYTEGENVVYNVCELNHNKVQPDDWYCGDAERREE